MQQQRNKGIIIPCAYGAGDNSKRVGGTWDRKDRKGANHDAIEARKKTCATRGAEAIKRKYDSLT